MKEEELIKKLESVELPEIQLESHRCRLRMALLDAGYLRERPRVTLLDQAKSRVKGGIDMIRGLLSRRPVGIRPALVAASVAVILVALLVLQPFATPLDPQRVLAAAYSATAGLQSFRMVVSHISTSGGEAWEKAFEVKFAASDRVHAKITANDALRETIIIGDKVYVHLEPNDDPAIQGEAIGRAPRYLILVCPQKTREILETLTDLERLPDEKIDGVYCFRYLGRIDEPGPWETEVELWIGKDDYIIRRLEIRSEGQSEWEGNYTTWSSIRIMRLYDFNEPIEIEPPKTAYGELLPGWQLLDRPSLSVTEGGFAIRMGLDQQMNIRIRFTIRNDTMQVLSNVQVSLFTKATNEEGGWRWNSPEPVTLGPGESETFSITWYYDDSHTLTSMNELEWLVYETTTILVTYTTPEGEEGRQELRMGLLPPKMPGAPPPPPPGEGRPQLNIGIMGTGISRSRTDAQRMHINKCIIIRNDTTQVLSNVQVSLFTKATNEEGGWRWNSPEPVTLGPGESETFSITWHYDAFHTLTSIEEMNRSMNELEWLVYETTTILVTYTTPEGEEGSQMLGPGPSPLELTPVPPAPLSPEPPS